MGVEGLRLTCVIVEAWQRFAEAVGRDDFLRQNDGRQHQQEREQVDVEEPLDEAKVRQDR